MTTAYNHTIFRSLLIWLGCFIFGYFVYTLRFGTNDDAAMALILNGLVNGVPGIEPRLIYISSFIGEALTWCLNYYPNFDFYSTFQIIVVSTSFIGCFFLFNRVTRSPVSFFISLFWGLLFCSFFLFKIQFTQTSISAIMFGFVLLLYFELQIEKKTLKHYLIFFILSYTFFVLGILIRSYNINLLPVTAIPLCISILFLKNDHTSKPLLKTIFPLLVILSAFLSGAFLENLENKKYYSTPGWSEYLNAEKYRSFVMHNNISQKINVGKGAISINDFRILHSWLIVDPILNNSSSLEVASKLIKEKVPEKLDYKGVKKQVYKFVKWIKNKWVLYCFVVVMCINLILLCCVKNNFQEMLRKTTILTFLYIFFIILLLLAITVMFRAPPARVYIPLFALYSGLLILSQLFIIRNNKDPNLKCKKFITSISKYSRVHLPVSFYRMAFNFRKRLLQFSLCLLILPPILFSFDFEKQSQKKSSTQCPVSEEVVRIFNKSNYEKLLIIPGAIDSTCFVSPYNIEYPSVLTKKAISFGWMGYTPWLQGRLFNKENSVPEILCKEPGAVLIGAQKNLRHLREYVLERNKSVEFTVSAKKIKHATILFLTCPKKINPIKSTQKLTIKPG